MKKIRTTPQRRVMLLMILSSLGTEIGVDGLTSLFWWLTEESEDMSNLISRSLFRVNFKFLLHLRVLSLALAGPKFPAGAEEGEFESSSNFISLSESSSSAWSHILLKIIASRVLRRLRGGLQRTSLTGADLFSLLIFKDLNFITDDNCCINSVIKKIIFFNVLLNSFTEKKNSFWKKWTFLLQEN